MPVEEQVIVVYAGVRGFLDKLATSEIRKFEELFLEHMRSRHADILAAIKKTGNISPEDDERISGILSEFVPNAGLAMKA